MAGQVCLGFCSQKSDDIGFGCRCRREDNSFVMCPPLPVGQLKSLLVKAKSKLQMAILGHEQTIKNSVGCPEYDRGIRRNSM